MRGIPDWLVTTVFIGFLVVIFGTSGAIIFWLLKRQSQKVWRSFLGIVLSFFAADFLFLTFVLVARVAKYGSGLDWLFPFGSLAVFGGLLAATVFWLQKIEQPKRLYPYMLALNGLQLAIFLALFKLFAFA